MFNQIDLLGDKDTQVTRLDFLLSLAVQHLSPYPVHFYDYK